MEVRSFILFAPVILMGFSLFFLGVVWPSAPPPAPPPPPPLLPPSTPTPNAAYSTAASNKASLLLDEAHPHGIIPVKTDPVSGKAVLNADGTPVYNYDLAIPVMLLHFFPTGILGLGLTALLASFMSGMAGNVTAFNTVW